ncbi:MAG TPA: hypothetical protein VFO18_03290 [Methylomirabilota bacterium]|nr:hypothetical protein [Methylomirabilota bacterium]
MTDRARGRLFLALATAGFVASALLHLATFTPLPLPGADGVALGLFAGAFVPLVAMIVRLRRAGTPTREWRRLEIYEWRALAALVPEPLRFATFAVVLYTLTNFVLSLLLESGGRANIRLLTGHLLLFYLLPLLYFRFVDPRRDGWGPADGPRDGEPPQ